jgi:glutaconate CoA-transferase subunit B
VITDLCIMTPAPASRELVVAQLHPGVAREQVEQSTGWKIRFAEPIGRVSPPTEVEIETLRDLQHRTTMAHS